MNVATITTPAHEAAAKYEEYVAALRGRTPTDEDKGVLAGLKAMKAGRRLVDLFAVFRACPPDDKGRPALAVARAHWRHCHARLFVDGAAWFAESRDALDGYHGTAWHRRLRLPPDVLAPGLRPANGAPDHGRRTLRAVVPLIPPNVRPARGLTGYCILWEADWDTVPTDPLLLRHLHGGLYAVFAHWDLTPLERAVLGGRLAERT